VVVAPGAPVDLGLTLPTGAGLRLTLADLATPPAGFEVALVTAAKPLAKLEAWPDLGPHGAARVPLVPTDTGTWLGLDLPPGPARLVLGRGTVELPHAGGSSFAYGETRQLAELDLEAGRTLELELELGELQPGELLVEVLADGLPLPGLRVQVQSFAGFGGTTLTGPLGFGEVDGLFPGEFVVKVVRPGVGEFRAAGQVTIRGGERSQVRIDATVVAGAVLVQGPDGAPLADASVRLTGGSLSSYVETDDEGRLEASLVPGVVQVSYREFDPSAGEWVDLVGELSWPAPGSAGQVRLLPK
jgi:hypothetical protein